MICDEDLSFLEFFKFFFELDVVNIALLEPTLQFLLPLDHLVGVGLQGSNLLLQIVVFVGKLFQGLLLFYQTLLVLFELEVILLDLL